MPSKKDTSLLEQTIPNRNLEILIIGLAISHFDRTNNQWKVFFPKEDSHPFRMRIKEINTNTNRIISENILQLSVASRIEIKTNNVTGGSTDLRRNYAELLDLSTLHSPINLINNPQKYSGFLTINQLTLFTFPDAQNPTYDFWKVTPIPNPNTKTNVRPNTTIGKAGIFAGEFAVGSITEVSILNSSTTLIRFTLSANRLYRLEFENFCMDDKGKECLESDFKHYYDIIDETQFTDKSRYELIPPPPPPGQKGKTGSCDKVVASNLVIPTELI